MMGLLSAFAMVATGQVAPPSPPPVTGLPNGIKERMSENSRSFLENKGQWPASAQFLARGSVGNVWLTGKGFTFDYFGTLPNEPAAKRGHAVGLTFEGGRALRYEGILPTRLKTDFLVGNKSSARGVGSFRQAIARDVYPGIDVQAYFDGPAPRYDLLVAPGANPSKIRLRLEGVDKVSVAKNGDLEYKTVLGVRKQAGLLAYQTVNGVKKPVSIRFKALKANQASFVLGHYDRSRALVIDPLIYGSYYGGDRGIDDVRSVASDDAGGTYITGSTKSPQFPAIFGPYSFNIQGGRDAFISKFQGDAYSHDYAALIGGYLDDIGQKIAVDPLGNVWIAGTTESVNFPIGAASQTFTIEERNYGTGRESTIDGGQYRILVNGRRSPILSWNASAGEITAAIEAADSSLVGKVTVTGQTPNGVTRAFFTVGLATADAKNLVVDDALDADLTEIRMEGLQPRYIVWYPTLNAFAPRIQRVGPRARFTDVGNDNGWIGGWQTQQDTTVKPDDDGNTPWPDYYDPDVSPIIVALDLLDLLGIQGLNLTFFPSINDGPADFAFLDPPMDPFFQINNNFQPDSHFVAVPASQMFVMRFAQSSTTVLDPFVNGRTQGRLIGGAGTEFITGFGFAPVESPTAATPMRFTIGGTTNAPLPEITGDANSGFFITYDYRNNKFTNVPAVSQYVGGRAATNLTGLAIDTEGNLYVSGTVFASGNQNTANAANPRFVTTDGVFEGGRLSRYSDIYVRKYTKAGALAYSALIGGNSEDTSTAVYQARYFQYLGGRSQFLGSTVAVDAAGNAYVTGVSYSFNYPRTRGVYGETFTDHTSQVVVTKLNRDASEILYSTNLRTSGGPITVSGIAVDARGQAYVTGILSGLQRYWNDALNETPGDPVTPVEDDFVSNIPVTGDALSSAYAFTGQPNLMSSDGFLLVLSPTATTLTYGSYIGNLLEDIVYAPYTDKFGDVWVSGSIEQFRYYTRVSSTGAVTVFQDTGPLVNTFITPLAFRESTEFLGGPTSFNEVYDNYAYGIDGFLGPRAPFAISLRSAGDAFLLKFRLGLPVVQSLSLDPDILPGGDAAGTGVPPSTVGTVTLSSAAPAGGVSVKLQLNSGFASFDPTAASRNSTAFIAEGQTSTTFRVYSRAVTENRSVQVRADYEGNFKIVNLVVQPWLQQLALSPTSTVGGNSVTGRVTIARAAPVGGVPISLTTSNASLVTFPDGASVVIPEGQNSTTFAIATNGSSRTVNVNVSASLLGIGKTQGLTLTPANLGSITFDPPRVARGNASVGTLTLDGKAGASFTVTLDVEGSATQKAGYVITPKTLTFAKGDTVKTFTVSTPLIPEDPAEPANTQRRIIASRIAQGTYPDQTISGTLFIDGATLTSLTFSPTVVASGAPSRGTVTIGGPAPQGGVVVYLFSSNSLVAVPAAASVSIPTGGTKAEFDVNTGVIASTTPVTFTAALAPNALTDTRVPRLTANLTVSGVTYTVFVTPSSVVGGNETSTGIIQLSAIAPPSGITLELTSSNPAVAQVPATVTVSGSANAFFLITTSGVPITRNINIRASINGKASSPAVLSVRPIGLGSITFVPSRVRGGTAAAMTVSLDAPAPLGGVTIALSATNPNIITMPSTVFIPGGSRSVTINVPTVQVARDLATTVTGRYNNSESSATLTVTR